MSCTEITSPTNRGTRLQFSLRALFGLMVLCSTLLAWFTNWRVGKVREMQLGERIQASQGHVMHAQILENQTIHNGLSLILPADCLYTVWYIRTGFADDQLMREMRQLRHLVRLGVPFSEVTDDGFQHVCGLPLLEVLDLSHTRISDKGLAHLAKHRRLQCIDLTTTEVTDAGLSIIAQNKDLQQVYLGNTHITDEGIKRLAGLPELTSITLDGTQVTGRVFEPLQQMPKLNSVFLRHTSIDDSAIPLLTRMDTLELLDVRDTRISQTGLAEIRIRLPRCQILNSESP